MGRISTGWLERLEVKYQEDRDTLIPRLLNRNGMTWLAGEAGVSLGLVSRYCTEHDIERLVTYRRIVRPESVAP